MALQTKTISGTTTSNDFTLKMVITENSTSVSGNTSSVSWELRLYSGGWNFSAYSIGWSVSLAGNVVSSRARGDAPQRTLGKNSYIVIASGTNSIEHVGGNNKMSVSASIAMEKVSYTPGNLSLSGSMTLTPIARASTITSAENISLGSAVNIKWTPADKSYKFRLYFTIGDYNSGWQPYITPGSTEAQTYTGFTVPLSVANQIENATYGTMTAHLATYNAAGTQIGSTQTKDFRVNVPADLKPTVDSFEATVSNSVPELGNRAVQGVSAIAWSSSASGAEGSTIVSRKFTLGSVTGDGASGSKTIDLPAGSYVPKLTVTDSRGRSAESSLPTITVYGYAKPTMAAPSVQRCAEDGTIDEGGTYASAYALAECSDVDGLNSVTLYYRKKTVGGSYGGYTELTNGQHNVLGGFAGDTSYVVELSALDTAGNRSAVEIDVPTAAAAFHLREGGRGAAFGKYAERDNLLECDWDAKFNGEVTVNGHSSPVGTVLYTEVGTVSVGTSATGNITSLDIPAGVWVIIGGFWTNSFSSASVGGNLRITLGGTDAMNDKNPAGNMEGYGSNTYRMTGSTEFIEGEVVTIRNLETDGTVYLNGYHSANTTIEFKGSIRAVRIE